MAGGQGLLLPLVVLTALGYEYQELHAAEKLEPLTTTAARRPAGEALDSDAVALEAKFASAALPRMDRCPCHVFGGNRGYYVFDTSGEIPSGLNHQQSNLKAILTEGLSLGRSVLLRKPTLTRDHNYNKPFKYNMWGDFIALNKSTLTLTYAPRIKSKSFLGGGAGYLSSSQSRKPRCAARLSECVADASESQLRELIKAPTTVVHYHNGSILDETNRGPLLVRGPDPSNVREDKVALVRKLPGFPGMLGAYQLRLNLMPPDHVAEAVPPIKRWLEATSTTGTVAVVHVRRGDKILNKKYCPDEMKLATSPDNIATVLTRAGVPSGSAIYIMSDETDFDHFSPLVEKYHYNVATNIHFDHLHSLLEGCRDDKDDGDEKKNTLPCENYLLFAIEKEIMASFPPSSRFVTIPRHDLAHNKIFLMSDFLGPGKPCPSL